MLDKNDTSGTSAFEIDKVKQIQWLEIHGQFNTSKTLDGDLSFITKNKAQAAYITQLGGAVTVSLKGHWHYLLNRSSLHLKNGEISLDRLSIISQDGISHDLEIHLQGSDSNPCISKVDYLQHKVQEELSIQSAIEEAELAYDKKEMQKENMYDDFQEGEERSLFEEIPPVQNEGISEEKVDEEEMLTKVHTLMLQKKEEARIEAETVNLENIKEEQRQKENKEKEKREVLEEEVRQEIHAQDKADEKEQEMRKLMGGDEKLLQIQELMNAPKQLDLAEIEMVGGDESAKVKQEEERNIKESEIKEKTVETLKKKEKENSQICLKNKIILDEADNTEVFKSSTYLEGFSLDVDGSYCFEPHEISYEYLIEGEEEVSTVKVSIIKATGKKLFVDLSFKVKRIKGVLSLDVSPGSFVQEHKAQTEEFKEMSLEDLAGSEENFSHHCHTQENTHVEGHLAVVFDSLKDGASLHSDGTLGITILLPVGAQTGEVIIVNGSEFIITDPEAEVGKLLYAVYPDDEVEVSYRDCDNNIVDSLRAQANHQSVEILEFVKAPEIMGEVGSQSVHAGIGESTQEGGSWGIINVSNEIVTYIESEFSSLKVDHETGELEYRYYEGSGLQKYGKSADNEVCEKFILSLGKNPYAELEVNIHIQVQSIYGYSGQEIDSTTIEEMKLLKYDPLRSKKDVLKDTNILEMLESGLINNKAKISKTMLEIYEAKSAGKDTSEAKARLQSLTDKKTHLEDKLNSLR